ncbi:MAG TPA: cobalamin biosynthesis protein, partial [Bryobacteraceae bacterium]|nr:cobalamin biosynthesis protein [Bryobacteraceae bacterium]
DGGTQPSPNAGYPEAAVAGAVGVRLGGENRYRGVVSRKAYLGDAVKPLRPDIYREVRVLLYGVAILATIGACLR